MGYLEGFRIPLQERLRKDVRTESYPDTIRPKPERLHSISRQNGVLLNPVEVS